MASAPSEAATAKVTGTATAGQATASSGNTADQATGAEASSSSLFSTSQPPSAGLERDVGELISRVVALFDEMEGLRFQHFVDIWKDMKFSLVFCGRQYHRELYELTEDVLDMSKRRALHPEPLPVRAASLYLLYSLYFKQPLVPKIKIRLTMDELTDLSSFMNECREGQHWDLVYVWVKLMQDHAFEFVASAHILGPEVAFRGDSRRFGREEGHHTRENPLKTDEIQYILARMSNLHTKYHSLKKALVSPGGVDRSLSLTSPDFAEQVTDIIDNLHDPSKLPRTREIFEDPDAGEAGLGNVLEGGDGTTIGTRRKLIREKAFSKGQLTKRQRDLRNFKGRSSESETDGATANEEQAGEVSSEKDDPATAESSTEETEASAGQEENGVKWGAVLVATGKGGKRKQRGKHSKRGAARKEAERQRRREEELLRGGITFDLEACERSLFPPEKKSGQGRQSQDGGGKLKLKIKRQAPDIGEDGKENGPSKKKTSVKSKKGSKTQKEKVGKKKRKKASVEDMLAVIDAVASATSDEAEFQGEFEVGADGMLVPVEEEEAKRDDPPTKDAATKISVRSGLTTEGASAAQSEGELPAKRKRGRPKRLVEEGET